MAAVPTCAGSELPWDYALPGASPRKTRSRSRLAESNRLRSAGSWIGRRRRISPQHADARICEDRTARWVEICYCPTPLQEERPYWEQFFDLTRVQDAHDRRKCRDHNGTEPWACDGCDCTARLQEKLDKTGKSFMESLRAGELTLINPLSQSGSGPTK